MKKIVLYIILFIIGCIIGFLIGLVPRLRYDLNNDGKVNVADIVKLVNYYLEH